MEITISLSLVDDTFRLFLKKIIRIIVMVDSDRFSRAGIFSTIK